MGESVDVHLGINVCRLPLSQSKCRVDPLCSASFVFSTCRVELLWVSVPNQFRFCTATQTRW